MRKSTRDYFERLRKFDLSQEFNALNALQETAWKINCPVLKVIRETWDSGEEWAGLPPKFDVPLPEYPFDKQPSEMSDGEKADFKAWRKRRGAIHEFNHKNMSKRIQIERTLQLAEDYRKYDKFYFVWQTDFRGRKYPVESFMSPQVADWGKAAITFSKGVPINNPEEAQWLAIHGANLFGLDKVSLADRELWAYMNEDEVIRTAENPTDNLWWTEADKPWQFLAWVFEWYGLLKEGYGFVSHLPVAADGSCNGLQNLSAILRDGEGGRAVNLIDGDVPADIYTDVANLTMSVVEREALKGDPMALRFMKFGVDRAMTKRPCMIVPYSGTLMACKKYVYDAMESKVQGGAHNPFENLRDASYYISKHIWDSIDGVIGSARKVMDYVKDIGAMYSAADKPMEWITPTNFLVRQAYPDTTGRNIRTKIDGSIVAVRYHKEVEGKINKSKTRTGASPNFIHSLDAAHLTMTINRCYKEGMTEFAMVHDSYGTHSSNMVRMSEVLRESFVDMYEQNDVLSDLRLHACNNLGTEDVPEPPAKGDLELRNVLNSKYFFA
jgi:DNA-directed RNA polymerase